MKIIKKVLAFALIGTLAAASVACVNNGGKGETITVSTDKLEFSGAGGTQTVTVTGGEWVAVPSEDWIEVLTDGGEITVTLGVNPTANTQSGSISVANAADSKTITVMQETLGEPGLTVDATELEFPHYGGTQTVNVTSDREWTATPSADWIEILPSDDGLSFDVVLYPNEEPQVTPTELEGTITVSNGVTSEDKTIDVWQALALRAFSVYPHQATVLYPDGEVQLELHSLLPENATNKKINWRSLDESIVTVDATGKLTAVSVGTTTVIATSDDTYEDGEPVAMDDCAVIVAAAWEPGTVSFRSATTWVVGGQEWSDTVLASGADKNTFTGVSGNTYIPDGMRNGDFGHMFSWAAANEFGDELCPAPWRIPSKEDFVALDIALGGTGSNFQATSGQEDRYRNEWGLEWAGQAFNSMISGSGDNDRANGALYWSKDSAGGPNGYALHIVDNHEMGGTPNPSISPNANTLKQYGVLVRCVKDLN